MDSNIPVVGGGDSTPDTPPTTTPAAEVKQTAANQAETSASGQPSAQAVAVSGEVTAPAMTEPSVTANGQTELPTDSAASMQPELPATPGGQAASAAPDHAESPATSGAQADSSAEVPAPAQLDLAAPDLQAQPPTEAAVPVSNEQAMLEGAVPGVKKGDILEGTILSTSPTEILIDIGQKSEGIIQRKELERMDRATLERLKPEEKVLVYVVDPEDQNGKVVLSITRAAEEKDWRDAETYRQDKTIYVGKIDGFNKGGLIVRFGRVRGFVPESQVSRERRERAESSGTPDKWSGMRNEEVAVKVVEVDRARNRLILSEREAAPQRREQMKAQLLGQLKVGDVRIGHVKSLSDFGAFVDVGGADGLVHLTEISWKHIVHPQDVLTVGQEVKVEVISIDQDRKRIGLSIKRQEEDPWTAVTKQYAIGDLVQATITKLVKFGAFARLVDNPEVEGLVHITELADHRVNHPRDVVREGDVLTLRVLKVDSQRRRIGLSLRRVSSPEFVDRDYARATGAPPAPPPMPTDAPPFDESYRDDDSRRRDRRKKGGKARRGGRDDFGGDEEEF